MSTAKSTKRSLAVSIWLLFASLAFACGTMFAGAHTAFAQQDEPDSPNAPDSTATPALAASGNIAVQDAAEQNYAVFDSSTSTLAFYYGAKPEAAGTQTIYEGYDTAATPYARDADRPWYDKKAYIKHVVFDPSVSGHLKPKNTAWWFCGFYSLEDVSGLSYLDASDVKSMAHMFDDCRSKLATLDFSSFNTANVTDMTSLFSSCNKLSSVTFGVGFTTANVTTMDNMFAGCSSLAALDVSGFNTTNVTTMNGMFSGCSKLAELDLTNFDTANVEDMASMFNGCSELTDCGTKLKLGAGFNTSKVTTMESMFQSCTKMATIAFPTNFSTENVTNMHRMFFGCSALTDPGISNFNTAKVVYFSSMFERCKSLTNLNVPFNTASAEDKPTTDNKRAFNCMFLGCSNLESITLGDNFVVPSNAAFTRVFESCTKLQQIPDLSHCITPNASNLYQIFYGCTGLENVDLSGLDLSGVKSVDSMFRACTGLKTVTFGNLNSGNLSNMQSLFDGCSKLSSVSFASLSTSSNCSMNNLFYGCASLENLDLSTWDTSKVTSMSNLFNGCSKLSTLDLSSWNTKSVKYFYSMFDGCAKLSTLKLGENFSYAGTNSREWTSDWALLPEHSSVAPYNGLWWKGPGTTTYTRYTMRLLDPADIAGTWTWSEGIAVTATVSPSSGGSVSFSPLNTGATGDAVTLTATPGPGYEFESWQLTSGDGTGTLSSTTDNPATFTLGSASGTVKATFKEAAYTYVIGALSATSFTYNGTTQAPTVTVTDAASGAALAEGTHYTVSFEKDDAAIASPTDAGTYTVYVTGAGDYAGMPKTSAGTFDITPASIAGKTLALSKASFTYNGKVQKPTVKTVDGKALKAEVDYAVVFSNANSKAAGSYTVTATGKGNYAGTSAKATYKIAKAANPIIIAKKTVSVKYAKLKKAKQTAAINTAKNAQGKVSYSITKAVKGKKNFKAKFSINKSTGKVTVSKGLAKGTYSLTVKAQAAGNGNYNAGYKTAAVTVKVK